MVQSSSTPKNQSVNLENQLESLGARLVKTLGAVLDSLPNRPSRPQEVARALGINKDLSSRLITALGRGTPLASVHHLPGPVPLRQFIQAAVRAGAPEAIAEPALATIADFDDYIRHEFGARSNLQGLLSTHVPDAREQLEATSKQAVFRGMAGIHGLEIEAVFVTFLVHPSKADPAWCDTAVINASFGLRRSRPNAKFSFTMRWLGREDDTGLSGVLLPDFCNPQNLDIKSNREGKYVRHTLLGNEFGRRHASDIVTTELYPKNHPLHPADHDTSAARWFYATVGQPARVLLFDVLIHESVWPGATPELLAYDTALHGEVIPEDPDRETSRLDLLGTVDRYQASAGIPRCAEVPRHQELLEHVCGMHGWSLDEFVGHRLQTSYPLFGSQHCMTFTPR